MQVKSFFKNHYLALILAVVTGAMMVFPQFLFILQADDQYQGFNIYETDGEYYYLARVREVYDQHYQIADPLMVEKDLPYVYPVAPEWLMGFTGKILHLDIASVFNLFRFIAPGLLFLLIYFIVLKLDNGNKRSALLASAIVLLATNLISAPQQLWQMLQGSFSAEQFSSYARPINPQLSSLFFFALLYSLWQLLHTSLKRYWYYCAILFSLSFYVYFYNWTFATVLLGLQLIFLLWHKKYNKAWKIVGVLAIGYLLAIPYFINLGQLVGHYSYDSLVRHFGLYTSHQFVFSSVLLLGGMLLLAAFFWLKREVNKNTWWFLASLVAAGAISINQQIITGRILQHGHYHWFFNIPVFILVISILGFALLRRLGLKTIYKNILLVSALFIVTFNVYQVQYASYQSHFANYLGLQKYQPVITWLNNNALKDQVVYVPGSFPYPIKQRAQSDINSFYLNQLIPIYTSLNVYYDFKAGLSLLPFPDYDRYNLMLTLKLLNVEPDQAVSYLRDSPRLLSNIYGMYFKVRGQTESDIPDAWLAEIADSYQEFNNRSWKDIFSQYPLDYIIWDKADLPDLDLSAIVLDNDLAQQVFEHGQIVVYKFL